MASIVNFIVALVILIVFFVTCSRIGKLLESAKETERVIKNISNMIESSDWNKLPLKEEWRCSSCDTMNNISEKKCVKCGYVLR